MSRAILAPELRVKLPVLMRRQTPSMLHRRMNAALLLDDGWSAQRIARAL